jgi:hypothetical protein
VPETPPPEPSARVRLRTACAGPTR